MRWFLVAAVLAVGSVLGVGGSALATHVFSDVPDDSTHAGSIHWAHEQGIVTGHADGTFRPGASIRRDQAAAMFERFDRHVERRIAEAQSGALEPMPPFAQSSLILDPGGVHVPKPVYVADTHALRVQGLMGVEDLAQEGGMVFLFESANTGGFWMKDTLIPLSIAYFDADGTVLEIMDMEPCEADPCPSYDPEVAYWGALEVNQGRFDDLGLGEPGWRVDVPADLWP